MTDLIPANRKPGTFPPGTSGNRSGRPKVAPFRRAAERVLLARKAVADGKQVARLEHWLLVIYKQSVYCLETAGSAAQITEHMKALAPVLVMLKEVMDGKANPVGIEAKKESRVVLVGGEIRETQEIQSVVETVTIETGREDGGVDR